MCHTLIKYKTQHLGYHYVKTKITYKKPTYC
jgi:hypothetical protein